MGNTPSQDSSRSGTHMISADDAEYPREYRTLGNGTRRFSNVGLVHTSERRHTVIAAQSLEALTGLQKSEMEMERKRDAFMDHLKNKYPQHALAIRGQQERIRDQLLQGASPLLLAGTSCNPDALMYRDTQENAVPVCLDNPSSQPNYWSFKTRSSRHNQNSQPGLADQAAKLSFASAESLETMSEAELPLGFNRMNRFRQSLPLSRSTSQTKLRSPGVLFLQYGDETRRVHITHEITSMDTLHALIVHMFQQKLTMGMLKSHNTAILIKDESRNVFYELEDVRDIQDRSIIKIYRKEPLYSSFPAPHITNGDVRVSGKDRWSDCCQRLWLGLGWGLEREMMYSSRDSSPTCRLNTMSPASHLASGSPPPVLQSSSPARSRMSYSGGRPPSYAGSPVHHGERISGLPPAQGVSPSPSAILERRDVKPDEDLTNKNVVLVKNEGLYADPYGMVHEGRLSITSTQSLAGLGDPFSYPGGLYKRGSVRSLSTYSAAGLQTDLEDGMYKPNSHIYGETYGTGLGFRMPPSSPQKVSDGRLVDVQQSQGPHSPYSGPSSRSSPVRQTFRKDSSSSVFIDSPVSKQRNHSSSSGNNEIFPGPGERPLSGFGSPVPAKDSETRDRMEAMEKQIASLTGLVQSALMRGSDSDIPGEKPESVNGGAASTSATGQQCAGTPLSTPTAGSSSTPADQSKAINRLHMQLHLQDLQHNASELRNQLQQLKKLQLQNQEAVRTMLKRTETEISVRVTDSMRKQEDPLQRQRAMVEEERLKYLNEEELITHQLNDLEKSVEKIKKDLTHHRHLISVQELEEKAMVLRQLGETLTELKAQFPSLQSKMRVVLRVEVEAVKFLKEEPHRLDGLLKRCKTMTDTLAHIRKQLDEGVWNTPENLHNQSTKQITSDSNFPKSTVFELPSSPPTNFHEAQSQSWESMCHSEGTNINPTKGEMVTVKTQTVPETQSKRVGAEKSVSVEAAERDWEEKRAALTQYSAKDINRLLEETQAELMKAIPDLDFAAKHKTTGSAPSTPEHRISKPQPAQKLITKIDPNGRRGSDELTVPRYRTEKPSKSPPPPPPRRSFPSSHGLTTTRTGEVIVTSKKEAGLIKKSESEELETQKPQVKLRRTVSEVVRPASTPPIIASGIKDDDDEDRIIAELEVFQRSSGSLFIPHFHGDHTSQVLPHPAHLWSNGATVTSRGWQAAESDQTDQGPQSTMATSHRRSSAHNLQELSVPPSVNRKFSLPQIILTEWTSNPPSPTNEGDGLSNKADSWTAGNCNSLVETETNRMSPSYLGSKDLSAGFHLSNLASDTHMSVSDSGLNLKGPEEGLHEMSHKDSKTEEREEIIGFIIINDNIVSLTTEDKNKLMKSGEVNDMTVKHIGEVNGNILAEQLDDKADGKPVLVLFEKPVVLEETYKGLWNLTRSWQPSEGYAEVQHTLVTSELTKDEFDESVAQMQSFQEPIEINNEELQRMTKPFVPVPRPRHIQGKDSKCQSPKLNSIDLSKVNNKALLEDFHSGSKLRVIDVQKMIHSASENTGHSHIIPMQEQDRLATDGSCVEWRSMDICRSTYKRLDSLEESIRELELTINEIGVQQPMEFTQHASAECRQQSYEPQKETGKGQPNMQSGNEPLQALPRAEDGIQVSSPIRTKPPLLPKPQIPKSGGVSIPPMKMVNPVGSRLKGTQQTSGDKSNKHSKQRMEYMRIQGHQQVVYL
ncbi:SRC kinase signaling inhibitor 1 isoform X5 [Xenopus laevis]|uniref:SRC kinase signaling inhibitor 1 isoform X5 n=1 Tax=Xenopus laevis TaxID=8355 RepID=A0A8J1LUN2_XENLA|nr:SRC kinase signaling inhibitor 1 isoform X5 [Xenopus laevis]XP_041433248.1 SRC kinase signaling inhibitor 1 isoform X5 [Xenopus laevis]